MATLYSPKISGVIPAFAGTIITIPFSHSKLVSQTEYDGFVLQIKDPLQGDLIIQELTINKEANAVTNTTVSFVIAEPVDETKRLYPGSFYKVNLAYYKNTTEIDKEGNSVVVKAKGYFSDMAVVKYLGAATPTFTMLFNSDFSVEAVYTPPVNDITEKLYSVEWRLYNTTGYAEALLEESGEKIINYSLVETTDTGSINITHQFLPYFFKGIERNNYTDEMLDNIVEENNVDVSEYFDEETKTYDYDGIFTLLFIKKLLPLFAAQLKIVAIIHTINGFTATILIEPKLTSAESKDYSIVIEQNLEQGIHYISLLRNQTADDTATDFMLIRKNHTLNLCETLAKGEQTNFEVFVNKITTTAGIIDFNLEHGHIYSYYLTYKKAGAQFFIHSLEYFVEFEDIFLCDATHILRLPYNPKVTGYKTTLQQSKTDTLGGEYPMFFKNGKMGYKEFSVSALASYTMDSCLYFINGLEGRQYDALKYQLLNGYRNANQNPFTIERSVRLALEQYLTQISFDIGHVNLMNIPHFTPTKQLTSYNMYMERLFKQGVLDWLNNGEFKLFKSAAEGNYFIRILNVTTAPEDRLGRMLWTFTIQVVEAMEYNAENAQKLNMTYLNTQNGFVFKEVHNVTTE